MIGPFDYLFIIVLCCSKSLNMFQSKCHEHIIIKKKIDFGLPQTTIEEQTLRAMI